MDKVTEFTGSEWSVRAVEKLRELWVAGVSAGKISHALGRPEPMVRAKAAELGLRQHVDAES